MSESLKRPTSNPFLSICEIHRQIYKGILNDMPKAELIELLEKAYMAGKKMDKRLRQYKYNYDIGFWEKNKKYQKDIK